MTAALTPDAIGAMVRLILTAALAWSAWDLMLLPSLRDAFRAKLFNLRRRLFLYAADGHMAYGHPAYVRLRSLLNGLLANAEEITFGRMWLFSAVLRSSGPTFSEWSEVAFAEIEDQAVHEHLMKLRGEIEFALALHLLLSPLAWFYLVCVAIRSGYQAAMTRLAERVPVEAAGVHEAGGLAAVG